MAMGKNQIWLKILNTAAFAVMITVNALANIIRFNGLTTGEVSKKYENLFTPAPYAFSIWGLIYVLLFCFTLWQFGVFKGSETLREALIREIGPWFIISSLANTAWVFAWHYRFIPLSVVFMLIILVSLAIITVKIRDFGPLERREKLLVRLVFSIYFGWITIATIANITVLLVSLGWHGFGLSEQAWMVIVLFVGLFIAAETMLRNMDYAYGLVIIWAYAGILVRYLSSNGYAGAYPWIIASIIIALVLLAAEEIYLLVSQHKKKRKRVTA